MLPEFFVFMHAERMHKRATRLRIQITILLSTRNCVGKKLTIASALLGEAFDLERTAQILEKWNALSVVARQQLLSENGPLLMPSFKHILEGDLASSEHSKRSAA